MPLAAMILCNDNDGEGDLPVLYAVAGQTQLEYLARTARKAGAGHIVLLAHRMPGPLLAAIDRLKDAGIALDVVRTARDAADSIHPDETLMLLPAEMVVPPSQMNALAGLRAPVLVTVPDLQENLRFERIDAKERWTGLALLDGALLRETASMLGDWQLGPTLLRIALQKGANRVAALDASKIVGLGKAEDARHASQLLAEGTLPNSSDWADHFLLGKLAQRAASAAMARQVSVGIVGAASACLFILSFAVSFTPHLAVALSFYVLASLPKMIAEILSAIGARQVGIAGRLGQLRAPMLATILLVWALVLWRGDNNLLLPLMASWAGGMLLLSNHLRSGLKSTPLWLAGPNSLALIILPFALTGVPNLGLGLAIGYAIITQIWLQRKVKSA